MWNVCKSRCDCLYQFCSSCVAFAKYLSLSFCCCVLGMILMSLVLMVYYGLFITFTPFVATEPHTAVKHEHVNSFDQLYPEINNEDEPLDENKPPINKIQTGYRQRRSQSPEIQQLSTPKLNSESLSSSKLLSSTISKRENQATSSVSSATDKPKNFKSMFKETISQTTESPDTIPDFQLSNHLVDSVFSAAEAAGMKEPLGLCRKHADVKVPEVKATLFPSEQAGDILNCINDLLRNQTKKQICLHLDPEMNAYLKWLLTTGESRERHKPIKLGSKEDFLFPSTCLSTSETEGANQATTQCFVEPQDRADFEHR